MKKEPESSGEELEQLGPYQLHEQVPQDELRHGELYRATHETSGITALVFKPAEGDGVPPGDWRVRCVSSASPGYVALEVEDSRWAVAPDKHSVEALMCLFESVREGVGRMSAAFPSSDEARPWRRMGLVLAGVVTVCALVFMLVRMDFSSQPSGGPDAVAGAAFKSVPHEESVDGGAAESFTSGLLGDTTPQGEFVFARPLPREPFKGQKRPPCTRLVEVELIGACWGPHKLRAPCPNELYEHQGECYLPIFSARPPPQSLGQ
ncbi:hypothetical protein ACN28E_38930 [Archangium lansingense]|uniref:hypothetical protein n=1 Tax=Archangium lansingense TaxID=2995310 RepID=UPI003B7670AD